MVNAKVNVTPNNEAHESGNPFPPMDKDYIPTLSFTCCHSLIEMANMLEANQHCNISLDYSAERTILHEFPVVLNALKYLLGEGFGMVMDKEEEEWAFKTLNGIIYSPENNEEHTGDFINLILITATMFDRARSCLHIE